MINKPTVILIRPLIHEYINSQSTDRFESSIGLVSPLNLCCIAASVEQSGFNALIYDCEANGNKEENLKFFLAAKNPQVVGISIISTNFRGALYTAKIVRMILPKTIIVCGGSHMMIFARETLSYDEFDYGFVGESEGSFVDFLTSIQEGAADFSTIPGLVWRPHKGITINQPYGFNQDLDALPFPAYHLLNLSQYQMPNTEGNVVSLFLSRGCVFSCGFCFRNPQLQKLRFKSVDRAIEEIGYMVKKHNIRSVNFVDECISLKKEYFIEFCEKLSLKDWNLKWQSPTRVTSIDEDIVRAAKRAGCHTFRLGIESGSDAVLKRINKGITTEASKEAVRICNKYGIKTVAYFIIGYLDETKDTIEQTINFAKKIKPDYAAFFPAIPMPGTDLCRESEERGIIPMDYWHDFVLGKRDDALPFIFPDAGKWTVLAYKKFYFSFPYIFKQMKTVKFYKDFLKNLRIALNFFFMKFNRKI